MRVFHTGDCTTNSSQSEIHYQLRPRGKRSIISQFAIHYQPIQRAIMVTLLNHLIVDFPICNSDSKNNKYWHLIISDTVHHRIASRILWFHIIINVWFYHMHLQVISTRIWHLGTWDITDACNSIFTWWVPVASSGISTSATGRLAHLWDIFNDSFHTIYVPRYYYSMNIAISFQSGPFDQ